MKRTLITLSYIDFDFYDSMEYKFFIFTNNFFSRSKGAGINWVSRGIKYPLLLYTDSET